MADDEGKRPVDQGPWLVVEVGADGTLKLPEAALGALDLHGKRELHVILGQGRVMLTSAAAEDPFATFTEWATESDTAAYADL